MTMVRRGWVLTIAMAALVGSAAVAGQTTTGSGTQTGNAAPPKVTFSENDRKVTLTWFDANQLNPPPGLRSTDRLSPSIESQLQQGFVLDQLLKEQVHPVPTDLLHMLAPPPGIYRYAIVGWHLVLIDDSYKTFDVIHIGHDR
jgi:hypothetical protein